MTAQWPTHIAIIPDGNGRWAKKRSLPRASGHQEGAERVKALIDHASNIKEIKAITLFAFSTENNKRPKTEIRLIMHLIRAELNAMRHHLIDKNIRLRFLGDRSLYPKALLNDVISIEKDTESNTGLQLSIALHYSGRWDILQATQRLLDDKQAGDHSSIDEHSISRYLQTYPLPEPDLLIRTSGEQRISNFLLWQLAYTELYITPSYWPDFDTDQFDSAIRWYQARDRRFGNITEE